MRSSAGGRRAARRRLAVDDELLREAGLRRSPEHLGGRALAQRSSWERGRRAQVSWRSSSASRQPLRDDSPIPEKDVGPDALAWASATDALSRFHTEFTRRLRHVDQDVSQKPAYRGCRTRPLGRRGTGIEGGSTCEVPACSRHGGAHARDRSCWDGIAAREAGEVGHRVGPVRRHVALCRCETSSRALRSRHWKRELGDLRCLVLARVHDHVQLARSQERRRVASANPASR